MTKREMVLKLGREHPDWTGAEIAVKVGVTRNYAATLLGLARSRGEIPPSAHGRGRPPPNRQEADVEELAEAVIAAKDERAIRDYERSLPALDEDAMEIADRLRGLRDGHMRQAKKYEAALAAMGEPS